MDGVTEWQLLTAFRLTKVSIFASNGSSDWKFVVVVVVVVKKLCIFFVLINYSCHI